MERRKEGWMGEEQIFIEEERESLCIGKGVQGLGQTENKLIEKENTLFYEEVGYLFFLKMYL